MTTAEGPGVRDADVVVVGAGTSGAALAGRLAAHGTDVLLVEAGSDWRSEDLPPRQRIPRADVFAWRVGGGGPEDRFRWPGITAQRMEGQSPGPYLRGRGPGGTSTINGLVVVRPPMEEFDDWEAAGCTGWGPGDVLPYFARCENDLDFGDDPWHGSTGPVPVVRRTEDAWGLPDHILADAARAGGHSWAPDLNAPGAFGVAPTACNIRMGVRVTTNDGYLEPVRRRPNFRLLANATADRVLVTAGRAVGVRVLVDGAPLDVHGKTVVLCAGAAATPGILQRSGIGPSSLLRKLGVPVVADLPVGEGMQDHVGFWIGARLPRPGLSRTGARGNMMLRWTSGTPGFGAGDLLMISANPLPEQPQDAAFGVKLAQVHSRGTSRIRSVDPLEPADIRLRLLSDERDRSLSRNAVRHAVELLTGQVRAGNIVSLADRFGDAMPAGWTDADLDAWLGRVATDTSHMSGGACMGSVLSPDLTVHGVEGLMVADLSAVPTVPRANPLLTAVMIGERAADLLRSG